MPPHYRRAFYSFFCKSILAQAPIEDPKDTSVPSADQTTGGNTEDTTPKGEEEQQMQYAPALTVQV